MELSMEPYTVEGLARREAAAAAAASAASNSNNSNNSDKSGEAMDVDPPASAGGEEEAADAPKIDLSQLPEHPPEYYNYKLVGILVHRGVADSGHYYSFIKERSTPPGTEPHWIEFNDETVRPFNLKDLERECFGGKEEVTVVSEITGNKIKKTISRTRNAYMLIYERDHEAVPAAMETDSLIQPSPLSHEMEHNLDESIPSAERKKETGLVLAGGSSRVPSRKLEENFTVLVPRRQYEEVWEENVTFLQDKKIFDIDYLTFVHDVMKLNVGAAFHGKNRTTKFVGVCIELTLMIYTN
jgi:hypothetical protein